MRDAELGDLAVRIDDDGQGIEGYRQFVVGDPFLGAVFHFLLQNRARCVGDVDLTAAELLETATGPGNAHGDLDLALDRLLEIFCDSLGDRVHGAGAVNLDQRFGLDRRRGERQECRSKNGSFHRFLRKLCTRPGARNGTCSTTPNASGAMFQKNESSQTLQSWASRERLGRA